MLTKGKQDISFLIEKIFDLKNENDFVETCLRVFYYQYNNSPVYRQFCDFLQKNPGNVTTLEAIPFMPVQFFKDHKIYAAENPEQAIFSSSGTTGSRPSLHFVSRLDLYEKAFIQSFSHFYNDPAEFAVFALLPSYLERGGSSLVYMADYLIRNSKVKESGFFLNNHADLIASLHKNLVENKKILLLGVTFALLDLAEKYNLDLSSCIVMETGGMKGRRVELLREEVHSKLKNSFNIKAIHSEYGMTELLSQSYSKGDGIFYSPPQMKILIREMNDPFSYTCYGKTGGVNIVDLANLFSCSFISTMDLGKSFLNGSFEILGRFDQSEMRGCNLMVQ